MQQCGMEKYFKRIGITFIVMATLFLGMGQANALYVGSTLGNSPTYPNHWNQGNPSGQALTTGQFSTATSVTFMYGNGYIPGNPHLTIMDADAIGKIGSTFNDYWISFSTSNNLLTFTGSTTLDANKTYWFLVSDDYATPYLTIAGGTSFVTDFGASLPSTYNNYEQAGALGYANGTYWSLSDHPLMFKVEGSPVPIPGAIWLFGSGLVGLVGIGRRRFKK